LKLACWELCCENGEQQTEECRPGNKPSIDKIEECEDASQPTSAFSLGPGNLFIVSDPDELCDKPSSTQTIMNACDTIHTHGTRMYYSPGSDENHPFFTEDTNVWVLQTSFLEKYLDTSSTLIPALSQFKTFVWNVPSDVPLDTTCNLPYTVFFVLGSTRKWDYIPTIFNGVHKDDYCVISSKYGSVTGQTDDASSEAVGEMYAIQVTFHASKQVDVNAKNAKLQHFMHPSSNLNYLPYYKKQ
jgi:hypothetical protein